MKILHISSAKITYPGGTEKVIWELAKRQAKKNKVTILQTNLYEENIPFEEEIIKERVKIITKKNNFFLGGFGYSLNFMKELKKIWHNYDIIHIHGHGRFTSNYAMGFLKNKKPFIYSGQGFFHTKKNNFFKKFYDFLYKNRLKKASFCTALTPIEKDTLIKMGVKEDKIKIIPGGVDLKLFKIKINKDEVKKRYLDKKYLNKKILLHLNRVHESKGIQHVINAIKDLDVVFLIAGKDAGYLEQLKKQVMELQIADKVKFLGMVSEKEKVELYKIADIFMLFSDWEGFGIVAIEAMAGGNPVIGSDKGSLPLIIKNRATGFIAKNEEELKEKINMLIGDKTLRERLSKNAKNFAKDFDWEEIVKKELNLYNDGIREFYGK